jgi:4-hydroxy-tetrahydrodipicolinate reductase
LREGAARERRYAAAPRGRDCAGRYAAQVALSADGTTATTVAAMITVGVLGARGRMGSQTCRAVEEADDLRLVAQVGAGDDRGALEEAQVAVDFTSPAAVLDNIAWCLQHGVSVVAGTSGFTPERLRAVRELLGDAPEVGVLVAPNFSIGAVLMMRFAAQAARFYESVEIVELHHPDKADAPSGTARRTAELVGDTRRDAGLGPVPDSTSEDDVAARGVAVSGVSVHSVRLRGLVASQEVLFGAPGETLAIRHDSHDRQSFMPGVLAAVRSVVHSRGLVVGLDDVLGLD